MRFNIYKHVGNTWLLALLINYLMFVIWHFVIDQSPVDNEAWGTLFILIIGLFIIGAPALFISLIFFRLIVFSSMRKPGMALALWCVSVIGAVILVIAMPSLIVFHGLVSGIWSVALPGVVAGVLAALIRGQQFYNLFLSFRHRNIHHQQNEAQL